jgi:hypothetical protein
MCPKKKNPRHFGHKKPEHVPEKEKSPAFRSQEFGTCARKGKIPGISVTKSRNMCPKKRKPRHYGHKLTTREPLCPFCFPVLVSKNKSSCQ